MLRRCKLPIVQLAFDALAPNKSYPSVTHADLRARACPPAILIRGHFHFVRWLRGPSRRPAQAASHPRRRRELDTVPSGR